MYEFILCELNQDLAEVGGYLNASIQPEARGFCKLAYIESHPLSGSITVGMMSRPCEEIHTGCSEA